MLAEILLNENFGEHVGQLHLPVMLSLHALQLTIQEQYSPNFTHRWAPIWGRMCFQGHAVASMEILQTREIMKY